MISLYPWAGFLSCPNGGLGIFCVKAGSAACIAVMTKAAGEKYQMIPLELPRRLGEPGTIAIIERWERYADVPTNSSLSLEERWLRMMYSKQRYNG